MKEVEVKAKVDSLDDIKGKLEDLGCKFCEPLVQKDVIYLREGVSFLNIGKGTVALRIRNSNGKLTMTLKKQLENDLDKIEREVVIDDFEQGDDILKYMGFDEAIRVSKKRIKCKYKGMEICLDEIEGLGSFVEAEKICVDEDSLEIQKELFDFLLSLGVLEENRVYEGYDVLLFKANYE